MATDRKAGVKGRSPAGLALLAGLAAVTATAQFAVRPDDPTGLSIREPRVRVLHSRTGQPPGSSLHLMRSDPWLAYRMGRSYFFREWGAADGALERLVVQPGAASATSCGMCHNLPFPSAGHGGTSPGTGSGGRTAPHLFGAGLLELIGQQIRAELLREHDTNGNGFLDIPAETAGRRAVVTAVPGVRLDFGALDDADGSGRPDLDAAILVRMVDAEGRRLFLDREGLEADLATPGVAGYDLATGVFASSAGDHQFPSLRTFAEGVMSTIFGLVPEGPVRPATGRREGWFYGAWGERSVPGSFGIEVFIPRVPGHDPARPRPGTVSAGEMDLLEWYLLNHPAPATGEQTAETRRGRALLDRLACTSCHVADWELLPATAGDGFPGDRRFFHLAVGWDAVAGGLRGRLEPKTAPSEGPGGDPWRTPRRGGFRVTGVFTDLRHHDVGPGFWEYSEADGQLTAIKRFRTPPLWGAGSTAPYGHDGQSPTLDHVIRRHGGSAEESAAAYAAAPAADRRAVRAFLRSLVLYRPEALPTDLDGDRVIASETKLGGHPAGPEVFRPELLFRRPPRFAGWQEEPDGYRWFSYGLENFSSTYRRDLPALVDRNGDTVPDLLQRKEESRAQIEQGPVLGRPPPR